MKFAALLRVRFYSYCALFCTGARSLKARSSAKARHACKRCLGLVWIRQGFGSDVDVSRLRHHSHRGDFGLRLGIRALHRRHAEGRFIQTECLRGRVRLIHSYERQEPNVNEQSRRRTGSEHTRTRYEHERKYKRGSLAIAYSKNSNIFLKM